MGRLGHKIIRSILCGAVMCWSCCSLASNTALTLPQLNHRVFTATEGAPSDIHALAQTPDGILWIGGFAGLTRFDGMRFMPYPSRSEEPLPGTNIATLFSAPDGALWIAFRPGGVSVLKSGHVTTYGEAQGLPNGTVAQFAAAADGSILAATRTGIARLRGSHWEQESDPRFGIPYGVLVDGSGTEWVATQSGLFSRAAGEDGFQQIDHRSYNSPWGPALYAASNGTVWGASSKELVRIDGADHALSVLSGLTVQGGPLLADEAGNLWVWDSAAETLVRVSARDLTPTSVQRGESHPEKMSSTDGVNEPRVYALIQDRESNVWIGTIAGLHRFSHTNVVRDLVPSCSREIMKGTGTFAAGDTGTLWLACENSRGSYVDAIRDGAVVSHQVTPAFTAAYRDAQGTIWFGGPTAIGHVEGGQIIVTPIPADLQGRPIQALVREDSGAIWVSVNRKSTFRFAEGRWTENGDLAALPHRYALAATIDPHRELWFGYPNNVIAHITGRAVRLYGTKDDLNVGNVIAILPEGDQIWVGGELGFARFDGNHFLSILNASGAPFAGVSGILRARNGDLWLNATSGIAHISNREIDQLLRNPRHRIECETFNHLDGVPGTAFQGRSQPAALETSDGRLWFSMTAGIISIDPTNLMRNDLPPPVTIWRLNSGAKSYPHWGGDLNLPVHTTDLQIDYSAGSLTVPERVHFRYKLEGLNPDWQDVGARREASYTNLSPGHYVFKVVAANNDGVWNEVGATMAFTIAPAFYQTSWFYALCGLAAVGVLGVLHQMRTRQVAAKVRDRLETRLAERERIARELHDTLLQGVQGLIWRFQAATDRIPVGEPARELMEQSLDRADHLLGESRDRVKDLRPVAGNLTDLATALATEAEEFAESQGARFGLSVQGVPRELHPIVREEGLLIAREALGNAFRHAAAENVEAEVTYGDAALQIRIRDDGRGIDASVLARGKDGHFGLMGMKERAKKLGAQLAIWSKPEAGTELDLRVPARIAYRCVGRRGQRARWRIVSRSSGTTDERTISTSEKIL